MQLIKPILALMATGIVLALPAPAEAAMQNTTTTTDYPLRCNAENLSVDSMNFIAFSLGQSHDPSDRCPGSTQSGPWLSYHVAEYGTGAAHVAISTRTLDLEYDETSYNAVAGAIDEISQQCGSLGGSTLVQDSDNIVVHVNSNFVG